MICRDNSASAVQEKLCLEIGNDFAGGLFLIVNYYLCNLYETQFV